MVLFGLRIRYECGNRRLVWYAPRAHQLLVDCPRPGVVRIGYSIIFFISRTCSTLGSTWSSPSTSLVTFSSALHLSQKFNKIIQHYLNWNERSAGAKAIKKVRIPAVPCRSAKDGQTHSMSGYYLSGRQHTSYTP